MISPFLGIFIAGPGDPQYLSALDVDVVAKLSETGENVVPTNR
jgi:hypothetical protein